MRCRKGSLVKSAHGCSVSCRKGSLVKSVYGCSVSCRIGSSVKSAFVCRLPCRIGSKGPAFVRGLFIGEPFWRLGCGPGPSQGCPRQRPIALGLGGGDSRRSASSLSTWPASCRRRLAPAARRASCTTASPAAFPAAAGRLPVARRPGSSTVDPSLRPRPAPTAGADRRPMPRGLAIGIPSSHPANPVFHLSRFAPQIARSPRGAFHHLGMPPPPISRPHQLVVLVPRP